MTLELEITHLFEQVEVPKDELDDVIKVASWQTTPSFPYPGRTAWHVFNQPFTLKNDKSRIFRAAKIKGVGAWNPGKTHLYTGVHESRITNDAPILPTTDEYKFTASIPHIGFTDSGTFEQLYSEPAPFGGILHRRGVQEFENATLLFNQGVSAVVPLLVARLPERYKFREEAMGVVVVLSEEAEWNRLHLIHFGEKELTGQEYQYYSRVCQALGIAGNLSDETTRLQVIKALSGQIGRLMHAFSAAGLYRHSGGWEDLQFCTQKKAVFLIDLDSSRRVAELAPCAKALQILRDLSSSIHKLLTAFYYPTILNQFTFSNLLRNDPIAEMLAGYFQTAKEDEIRRAAGRYWDYFAPHLFQMKRYHEQLLAGWDYERRTSYKMDDDLFYALSVLNLFPLYCESDLNSLYPRFCDLDTLKERAQTFLGERYEYLDYLLAGQV